MTIDLQLFPILWLTCTFPSLIRNHPCIHNNARTNPTTHLPQISESRILEYAKYLSEDIGYRTVGTREHALADTWMLRKAEAIKEECERIVREDGRKLECEVWRQEGSGSHRYVLTNIFYRGRVYPMTTVTI